jgi:hypothetical protein
MTAHINVEGGLCGGVAAVTPRQPLEKTLPAVFRRKNRRSKKKTAGARKKHTKKARPRA